MTKKLFCAIIKTSCGCRITAITPAFQAGDVGSTPIIRFSMKNYTVKSSTGETLDVNYYESSNSKSLIQILHGMQEYKERYNDFAEFLVANGYNVLIHDHLGHGKSISAAHPLGDMVAFDAVVKDIDLVRKSVDFSGEYICFGHSMGSFLARIYSSKYSVDRLIVSGTGQTPSILATFMQSFLRFQKPGVPLPKIQKILMGPMGKRFDNPADWLSLDKENQQAYADDPLCGQPFTREGYRVLLDIVKNLNKKETYRDCSAKSILMISGEKDPVGNFTKGVKKAEAKYKSFGKQVKTIFYKNMSHEILNETEHQTVYQDILDFLRG